jgi:hypothetical protein
MDGSAESADEVIDGFWESKGGGLMGVATVAGSYDSWWPDVVGGAL